jgi:AraC-like DNA-binding protein
LPSSTFGRPPLTPQTLPHPSVHVTVEGRRAEVGGVSTQRFVRTLTGRSWVFGIKFRPAMFAGLLGAPLSSITDRTLTIGTVFGARGVSFARQLADDEFSAGVQRAEAFLCPLLHDDDPLASRVRDLVELAAVDRSLVTVEQLAARAGVTKRTLQRQFDRLVGVSPKWVLQRYRLHEANERLKKEPNTDLADLALELGYVDQPHFARDFKSVVGVSPGAYAKR